MKHRTFFWKGCLNKGPLAPTMPMVKNFNNNTASPWTAKVARCRFTMIFAEFPMITLKSAWKMLYRPQVAKKRWELCANCGIVFSWCSECWIRSSSNVYGDSHTQTLPFITWQHITVEATGDGGAPWAWCHWVQCLLNRFPVQMHYECRWRFKIRCWSMMSFVKCEFFSKSKAFNIHDMQYMMISRVLYSLCQ